MKSVVIQQPNELVIEERPLPQPGQVKFASKSRWRDLRFGQPHLSRP
jgi:hypothetical protein